MLTEILQRMKLLLALALFSPSRDRKHQSTFSCRPPEYTTQGIAFQGQTLNSVTRQRRKVCRISFLEGPHTRLPAVEIFAHPLRQVCMLLLLGQRRTPVEILPGQQVIVQSNHLLGNTTAV